MLETETMTAICVRRATAEDARNIARLWLMCTTEVAQSEPIYKPDISENNLAALLTNELDSGQRLAWVAEHQHKLAAYVTTRIEHESPPFAERQFLYIIDLDVAPDHRGRGLSYLLMKQVEHFARSKGITRLELAYVTKDPRPQTVWARHGFSPYIVHAFKTIE